LVEEFIKGINYTVYGAIIHKPIKNNFSIKLIKEFGFNEIEEITVYNGLTFGIYKRTN
jgi:hypothetical protein